MKWCMISVLATVTLAYSSHPFVGKPSDETHIKREDGSIAMRMKQTQTSYNKFSNMMDTKISFDKPMSTADIVWESVFGKTYSKQDFEDAVDEYIESKQRASNRHHKLGASSIPTLMTSDTTNMWTGSVYMGSWQPMDVVFDTGSDWLMIESSDCVNCEGTGNTTGQVYNTTKGEMVPGVENESMSQRFYGAAVMLGHEFEDSVCLLLTECVNSFKYFAIYQQEGLVEPVDGVMGMARNNQFMNSDSDADHSVGPLFVEALYNDGVIDEYSFSFFMDGAATSYVDFGSPQESAMKDPDELAWMYPN